MPSNPFQDGEDPFAKARGRFGRAATSFEQVIEAGNKGKLFLVTPTLFQEKIQTRFTKPGEPGTDAVTADVVIFSDDGEDPVEHQGVMLFAKVVVGQVKGRIGGDPVLGVLSQVPSQKGNDAWLLDSDVVTEAQIDQALAYLEAKDQASKAAKKEQFKETAKVAKS